MDKMEKKQRLKQKKKMKEKREERYGVQHARSNVRSSGILLQLNLQEKRILQSVFVLIEQMRKETKENRRGNQTFGLENC